MSPRERVQLLFGPYEPPPLRKGDRATCVYRDALVVVTSWSDGRLSWPRCRAIGRRGGSGLLVEEELALLGTAPDDEVAARIGRTEGAATKQRCRLGIPTFCDRRRETHGGPRR